MLSQSGEHGDVNITRVNPFFLRIRGRIDNAGYFQ